MARGITENDVHEAADALVSAGERPTVECIRAHPGTGSPNTVTRHLDSWWGGLGARLHARRGSAAVPDAPAEVTDLASRFWETALSSARSVLEGGRAIRRASCPSPRTRLHGHGNLDLPRPDRERATGLRACPSLTTRSRVAVGRCARRCGSASRDGGGPRGATRFRTSACRPAARITCLSFSPTASSRRRACLRAPAAGRLCASAGGSGPW